MSYGYTNDLLDELFKILDTMEETDEGRVHRPIKIVSTREHLRLRLERVLSELKATRGKADD